MALGALNSVNHRLLLLSCISTLFANSLAIPVTGLHAKPAGFGKFHFADRSAYLSIFRKESVKPGIA